MDMNGNWERFRELASVYMALVGVDSFLDEYSRTLMKPEEGPIIDFQRSVQQEVARELVSTFEISALIGALGQEILSGRQRRLYDEIIQAHRQALAHPNGNHPSDWERFHHLTRKYWAIESSIGDLEVYRDSRMPKGEARRIKSWIIAHANVAYGILTSPEMGNLVTVLMDADLTPDQRVIHNQISKNHNERRNVPVELAMEEEKLLHDGSILWPRARKSNNFGLVAPNLERIVETNRKMASLVFPQRHPYEALACMTGESYTLGELREYMNEINYHLSSLIESIFALPQPDNSFLRRVAIPQKAQAFIDNIVSSLGFSFEKGSIGKSDHPFAFGYNFTVGRRKSLWENIGEAFHEAGHAMYDQSFNHTNYFDPIGTQESRSVDEGIALFFENHVGLSRAFWRNRYHNLQNEFPNIFRNVDFEQFYSAINCAKPRLVRLEAEDLTYVWHIIFRIDMEIRLAEGSLAVRDIPLEWNRSMQKYFGITPPNDRLGALQDMHWPTGGIPSFGEYLFGSIISSQLRAAMGRDIPEIDHTIEGPQLKMIGEWLYERIFRHGTRYETKELIERATGKPLGPEDHINYLFRKFGELYRLPIEMRNGVYSLRMVA